MVDNSAEKLTFNFGVKYQTGFKGFRFAMAIRNFSTEVKYEEVSSQMPLIFMVGIGVDALAFVAPDHGGSPLLISAEFLHPNNHTTKLLGQLLELAGTGGWVCRSL